MESTKEILMGLDRETLVDMVMNLANDVRYEDAIPEGMNLESGFKDQLYFGGVDKDLEFETVVPSLSHITYDKDTETFYLNGDVIDVKPNYRSLKLEVKGFTVTGLVKTEIIGNMIKELHSLKVGENQGWVRWLIDYRGHTLVASIKGTISALKLLKHDHMATQMYSRYYKSSPIVNWRELQEDEKIYGSKEISLPNAIDTLEEEVAVALETLEKGLSYTQTANLIDTYGWRKDYA